MNNWQPIETAPKNDTSVLMVRHWDSGCETGVIVVVAHWICRKHYHSSRYHACPDTADCDMGWSHYAGRMSHWMPLPKLPEGIADGNKL